jgi:hypothetical protein
LLQCYTKWLLFTKEEKQLKKTLFFVVFISLVLFANGVSAEEMGKEKNSVVQRDIMVKPSWELLNVSIDKETGVAVEIYQEKVSDNFLIDIMNGEWDWVANSYWNTSGMTMYADPNTKDGKIVDSTGGDFMISIYPHARVPFGDPKTLMQIQLYEKDPTRSTKVGSSKVAAPNDQFAVHVIWRGIDDFVDGTDKKAEFYAVYGVNYYSPNEFLVVYSD